MSSVRIPTKSASKRQQKLYHVLVSLQSRTIMKTNVQSAEVFSSILWWQRCSRLAHQIPCFQNFLATRRSHHMLTRRQRQAAWSRMRANLLNSCISSHLCIASCRSAKNLPGGGGCRAQVIQQMGNRRKLAFLPSFPEFWSGPAETPALVSSRLKAHEEGTNAKVSMGAGRGGQAT